MRVLLDTHILILLMDETDRLPAAMRSLVHKRDAELFASVASVWEVAIKVRSGKLKTSVDPAHWQAFLAALNIALLPIDAMQVLQEVDPWPTTHDPFDRLLLAVCQRMSLRLVTLDRALRDHPLAYRASA